jgi:protoheme IX farnesyltransferase
MAAPEGFGVSQGIRDWMVLSKARIQVLSTPVACACTWMASEGTAGWGLLAATALGLTLVSSSAAALNQLLEIKIDSRMERTKDRPLPAGRIKRRTVAAFVVVSAVAGLGVLLWADPLAAWLGLVMIVLYDFIYTPLKRVTPLNTLVGALPGAFPLLVGWAAAGNGLDLRAGVMFAILFLWQLPHFMAIAWLFRDDYGRAGLRMLSGSDTEGLVSARQAIHYAMTLVPVSLLPAIFGMAGRIYLYGALTLGLAFLAFTARFGLARTTPRARTLMLASLLYLPALLGLLLYDQA